MQNRPTIGLALSGSGNRSAFYIGFLETLHEAGVKPDYITACSGGSLVVAAYAAGTLDKFKKWFLSLPKSEIVRLMTSKKGKGGLFSLDLMEAELQKFCNGLTFNQSKILMSFIAVDIESGELIELSMGSVARAARISATMPGLFEPVSWGSRILVDGGLLCVVPLASLKKFKPDIAIGIDMRATPNIFTATHINIKRFFNAMKRMFFIDEIKGIFMEGSDKEKPSKVGALSVLNRSLDLVIEDRERGRKEDRVCDLLIEPDFPRLGRVDISENAMKYYYEMGILTAQKYLPEIKKIIEIKSKKLVYVE